MLPLSLESRFFVSFIEMVRLFKRMKWRSREKRGFTISLEKKMSEKIVLILMKKQQKQQPMLGQEQEKKKRTTEQGRSVCLCLRERVAFMTWVINLLRNTAHE